MKKILLKTLFVLGLLCVISLEASAYDFSLKNDDEVTIYYNIISSSEPYTVEVTSGDSKYTGAVNIPSSVTYDGKTYSVTGIGEFAFYDCNDLTSVTIPNSVTSISDYAFSWCVQLASIEIPNSVKSIGFATFSGCFNLQVASIGKSVTSIGGSAFLECSNLNTIINLSTTPQTVSNGTFSVYGTLHVPEGCKDAYSVADVWQNFTIADDVISKFCVDGIWYNITSYVDMTVEVTLGDTKYTGAVNIPSNVTYKGITYSVTSIGERAFQYNSNLTSVIIGNSVTTIGAYAFHDCSGLKSIEIPNSVTSIGEWAFYNCGGLTSIKVAEGNTKYDSREDCNAIIETSTNTLIRGCENTIIPNSVTSIGERAFDGSEGLKSITIPNSVTTIGVNAFMWCEGLTSVTIGNSVTTIGNRAFIYCSGLTSVTIPNSVTSIGERAFYDCGRLTSVIIGKSVTSIGAYAFYAYDKLTSVTNLATTPQTITKNAFSTYGTLHVLKGCKDAYSIADYWKNFTIVEDAIDPTGIEEIGLTPALSTREGVTYDLQGKRVEQMKQGEVYIHNGRKFIAK